MNVVLVMFKDQQRRDFPLKDEKTILGRRQDCGLRIPTQDVSRQHCEVLILNQKILAVKDLGSSNGTFVNGKRVAEVELQAGDRLRVGPVTFIVQVDGKPAKVTAEDVAPATSADAAVGAAEDVETFELGEGDFDMDAALDDDDERDMP